MILEKKKLAEKKATFNKISNTLRICDWRVYYQISVKYIDAESLISDPSNQSEHGDITRRADCLSSMFDVLLEKKG